MITIHEYTLVLALIKKEGKPVLFNENTGIGCLGGPLIDGPGIRYLVDHGMLANTPHIRTPRGMRGYSAYALSTLGNKVEAHKGVVEYPADTPTPEPAPAPPVEPVVEPTPAPAPPPPVEPTPEPTPEPEPTLDDLPIGEIPDAMLPSVLAPHEDGPNPVSGQSMFIVDPDHDGDGGYDLAVALSNIAVRDSAEHSTYWVGQNGPDGETRYVIVTTDKSIADAYTNQGVLPNPMSDEEEGEQIVVAQLVRDALASLEVVFKDDGIVPHPSIMALSDFYERYLEVRLDPSLDRDSDREVAADGSDLPWKGVGVPRVPEGLKQGQAVPPGLPGGPPIVEEPQSPIGLPVPPPGGWPKGYAV